MPAPTTLTAARPSTSRARPPSRAAERRRAAAARRAGSRARSRPSSGRLKMCSCLPGHARSSSSARTSAGGDVALEHERCPARWRRRRPCPACAAGSGGRPCRRSTDPGRAAAPASPGVDRDSLFLGELDRLRVQHLRARFRHLLRFFVRQRADAPRRRHDARVRGVDAVDVGADLAVLGVERRGHGHRGGIAAAAPERRDFLPVGDALIAGDDDDPARATARPARGTADLDDARVDMAVVGDDARLAAGEADGVAAQLADRHREQRHRDPLAGGQQHVQLAPIRVGRHLLGHRQQVVGRVAHRRHDDDDVVAQLPGAHDARRRPP